MFQAYDAKLPLGENRHPDSEHAPPMEADTDLLAWMEDVLGIVPAPWEVHEGESPAETATLMDKSTQVWADKRSDYPYEIDGVVFKLDNLEQRERLGMTAHHPRWALAWKFPLKRRFPSFSMSNGKPGERETSPVARIAPQRVGGVTVEEHHPAQRR